jgi:hypothetical protein
LPVGAKASSDTQANERLSVAARTILIFADGKTERLGDCDVDFGVGHESSIIAL